MLHGCPLLAISDIRYEFGNGAESVHVFSPGLSTREFHFNLHSSFPSLIISFTFKQLVCRLRGSLSLGRSASASASPLSNLPGGSLVLCTGLSWRDARRTCNLHFHYSAALSVCSSISEGAGNVRAKV